MSQDELRVKYFRFIANESLESNIEMLDIFIHGYFNMILSTPKASTTIESDGRIMLQMMTSKLLHLRKLLNGITYFAPNGQKILDALLDPTVISVLVRNIFETVCTFNIVFINTKSDDERRIIHNLWSIAGFEYRQKFKDIATSDENRLKAENEKDIVLKLRAEIEETDLFKSLDNRNQKKIIEKIKDKDYKISFGKQKVIYLSWQDISKILLPKFDALDKMYIYFSLYAHPSHVSVWQYKDLFNKQHEGHKELTRFNTKICLILSSIFLSDFIKTFPDLLPTFERESILNQILMNAYNQMFRGESFSINNSWKSLG
jgi:hypothetical protein